MKDDWAMVDEVLASLPRPESDVRRAERVRIRCHARLTTPRLQRRLETLVLGGFCAAYLCALVVMALRTHGLL